MSVTRHESAPIPLFDPIAEADGKQKGFLTDAWIQWFDETLKRLASSVPVVASTGQLAAQSASIPATDLAEASLPAGVYRLSYYARITRPATVASSLTVALSWTDGGVVQTFTGAAINGNLTTSYQTDTVTIRIDSATPVTYTLTYATAGAVTMLYSFDLEIEELGR